jgi:two-component system, chemotaxis family, sensor kinase CheA
MDNICVEDPETIHEFLVESDENLSRLDRDLVELEKHPHDALLLGSIFRTIHTIKGTCGFLAFSTLEGITHQAESILSQLRDGERELTSALVSLILETVDATRKVLASIEESGKEGPVHFEDLIARLRAESQTQAIVEQQSVPITVISDLDCESIADEPHERARAAVTEDRRFEGPDRRKRGRRETDGDEDEFIRNSAAADSNIRVGVGLLDRLLELVGELVLIRNQILQLNRVGADPDLAIASQTLNLITTGLREAVMKMRKQPIGVVWNKLPRAVRDIAVHMDKEILLELEGAEIELDRTIIEAIKDPLMHLVRNSCDHGIESPEVRRRAGKPPQGRLTVRAYHEADQINIEVRDDGAGIDVARIKQKAIEKKLLAPEQAEKLSDSAALRLIFEPGISTAQTVTNISGRGVGMDVVKTHIEKIGGVVDIFSELGEGCIVTVRIPLTSAIIPGLAIASGANAS